MDWSKTTNFLHHPKLHTKNKSLKHTQQMYVIAKNVIGVDRFGEQIKFVLLV